MERRLFLTTFKCFELFDGFEVMNGLLIDLLILKIRATGLNPGVITQQAIVVTVVAVGVLGVGFPHVCRASPPPQAGFLKRPKFQQQVLGLHIKLKN
jgi:hypothetical protein